MFVMDIVIYKISGISDRGHPAAGSAACQTRPYRKRPHRPTQQGSVHYLYHIHISINSTPSQTITEISMEKLANYIYKYVIF